MDRERRMLKIETIGINHREQEGTTFSITMHPLEEHLKWFLILIMLLIRAPRFLSKIRTEEENISVVIGRSSKMFKPFQI